MSVVPGAYFSAHLRFWHRSGSSHGSRSLDAILLQLADDITSAARTYPVTEVETASMAAFVAVQAGVYSRQLSQSFSLRDVRLDVDGSSAFLTDSYWAEIRMSKAKAASLDAYLEGVQSILQRPGLAALWWMTERPGHLHELEGDAFKAFVAGQEAAEVAPSVIAAADATDSRDEAGTVLLEFVNRLQDPDQRAVMAGMLKNLLMFAPAASGEGADDSRLEG